MRTLLTYICLSLSFCLTAQCNWTTPNPFPSSLTIGSGQTLCIDTDYTTPWSSVAVQSGGLIRIYNSSIFRVQGSLTVYPGGYVDIEDCGSKLEVYGTYNGGYNTCELRVYCDTCSSVNHKPFELIWGTKIWDEWCCQDPLPVELISYTGNNNGQYNLIKWKTATEVDNDYFVLQKSADGINWNYITQIDGTNAITGSSYQYKDFNNVLNYYYKLTCFNINGTQDNLNEIIKIKGNGDKKELYRVNIMGNIVNQNYRGYVIIFYNDGSTKSLVKTN